MENPQQQLVLLVHGIRDFGRWQGEVAHALREHGLAVELVNYGRVNLVEFLLPIPYFRNKAKSSVWTQIQHAVDLHPGKKVSVIAHSFGTYVTAHLLKEQFTFRVNRIIFCGSVVPYDFPFEQIQERFFAPIINEVGTKDPWPAVAEAITTGYGSAGTFGFRRPGAQDRFHNGADHSYFLNRKFCSEYWLPLLCQGQIASGDVPGDEPSWWIRMISILQIKWFGVTFAILAALYGLLYSLYASTILDVSFGQDTKYVYWRGGITNLIENAGEPCPLPFGLCAYPDLVSAITERRYVNFGRVDDALKQIVSCRNFLFPSNTEISPRDPVAALEALSVEFPACVRTEMLADGKMNLIALIDDMDEANASDMTPIYLCGCSDTEVEAY